MCLVIVCSVQLWNILEFEAAHAMIDRNRFSGYNYNKPLCSKSGKNYVKCIFREHVSSEKCYQATFIKVTFKIFIFTLGSYMERRGIELRDWNVFEFRVSERMSKDHSFKILAISTDSTSSHSP